MTETAILSVIFCTLILIYACYSDLKRRSVTNYLWALMIAVGIPLAVYNIILHGTTLLVNFIFSVLFTSSLSYLLFRLHLFGGADAKSLICISLLIPTHPGFNLLSYHFPIELFPFAISTLLNAAILSLIVPFSLFFYNLLNLRQNGLRRNLRFAFLGYKLPINALTDVKHRHIRLVHSYEEEEENLERRFSFDGIEINKEVAERLKNYSGQGKIGKEVWVTPELPFMLFITSGFFVSLFYGNLIFYILLYF